MLSLVVDAVVLDAVVEGLVLASVVDAVVEGLVLASVLVSVVEGLVLASVLVSVVERLVLASVVVEVVVLVSEVDGAVVLGSTTLSHLLCVASHVCPASHIMLPH